MKKFATVVDPIVQIINIVNTLFPLAKPVLARLIHSDLKTVDLALNSSNHWVCVLKLCVCVRVCVC